MKHSEILRSALHQAIERGRLDENDLGELYIAIEESSELLPEDKADLQYYISKNIREDHDYGIDVVLGELKAKSLRKSA
jgi:hypothetical protein